jgi:hypothetical protein
MRQLLVAAVIVLSSCGDDQDAEGAAALWGRLQASSYRTTYGRPVGYSGRTESATAHGDEVEIFVNAVALETLRRTPAPTAMPPGAIIVKDVYKNGELKLVAAMEKRFDGWFWAEWDNKGESVYSGRPGLCIDCHRRGEDFIRALPPFRDD